MAHEVSYLSMCGVIYYRVVHRASEGEKSVAKVPNEFLGLLGLTGKDMVHFASILLD